MMRISCLWPLSATMLLSLLVPELVAVSNHVVDELEHLLVDTSGANDGGFKRAITPCTNYVSGSQLLGRETAAQWMRVAFHDFITANVTSGTGGIDASIGFETLRAENSGSAMNDSLGFFAPFISKYVSMADLIALSVVMAVGGCGGPNIPLRVGRIDAVQGGPFGVPEPETSIEKTLFEFSNAGFDKSDSIALTACGHTMGSVHHGGFPQVVPASAIGPNNTAGGIHLDSTPAAFDIDVVQEYLDGTGQKGGPLVTTSNVTVRSDLRLYLSDNNKTMQVYVFLSQSSTYFAWKCTKLFSRMLDTVPREVQLSDPINPMSYKPVNVSLSLDWTGQLSFSGAIRYLEESSSMPPVSEIFLTYKTRNGHVASSPISAIYTADPLNTGSSLFGTTYYYRFFASIDVSTGMSAFMLATKSHHIQDAVIFLPAMSSVVHSGNGSCTVNLTAAVLTSSRHAMVEAVLSVPSTQIGTLSPRIETQSVPLDLIGMAKLYTIYSAILVVDSEFVYRSSVDIVAHCDGRTIVDEFRKLIVLQT